MTTITDNFNRADNSSSLGSSSEGWSWTAVSGTWGITSNSARVFSAGNLEARAEYDLGSPDHYAQCTIHILSPTNWSQIGICARFDPSADTCYYLMARHSYNYQIAKVVAGSSTIIATGSVAPSDGDVIKIVVNGTSISGYANGSLAVSITDSSITSGNYAGMHMNQGTASSSNESIDDFSAGTLGGSVIIPPPLLMNRMAL